MNIFNAEALRRARLSKRITQADLGMQVGMSSASVCRIERGDRLPTASEIEAFARALDSMAMKEVDIPQRDISVATRLAGLQHRIKVQISVEQILSAATDQATGTALSASAQSSPGAPLVFYVPLDGLSIDSFEEEEEIKTQTRPRQR